LRRMLGGVATPGAARLEAESTAGPLPSSNPRQAQAGRGLMSFGAHSQDSFGFHGQGRFGAHPMGANPLGSLRALALGGFDAYEVGDSRAL
jgi:hypothetical protein